MTSKSVAFKYYGTDINADVDIRAVLSQYVDTTENREGKIKCPSLNHTDDKPSAVIYDHAKGQNHCYCYSCGTSMRPIDVVMQYENCTFPDACEILIQRFGLPLERYSNIDEVRRFNARFDPNAHKGFTDSFPLTSGECAYIGLENAYLNKAPNPNYNPYSSVSNEPAYIDVIPLPEQWKTDKEAVEQLLISQCQLAKSEFEKMIIGETITFQDIYATKTEGEWNEAKLIYKACEDYKEKSGKLPALGYIQMNKYNAIKELYSISERIVDLEDIIDAVDKLEDRILQQQKDRAKHIAQNKITR